MQCECFILFTGGENIEDYKPYGEETLKYLTADGIPGWFKLSHRGVVNISKNFIAQVETENLPDKNDHYFASGIFLPGRNFIFSLKLLVDHSVANKAYNNKFVYFPNP